MRATLAAGTFAAALAIPGQLHDRFATGEAREPAPVAAAADTAEPSERQLWLWRVEAQLESRIDGLSADERSRLATAIVDEALAADLDPALVLAIIAVESDYDLKAESHMGALGLMQVIPETFREGAPSGNPDDPVGNVQAGVRYYRRLHQIFKSQDLALMAYNAGPQRMVGYLKAGGVPERFRVYPRRVAAELRRLRRAFALDEAEVAEDKAPRAAE